jgi:hypothetical protein
MIECYFKNDVGNDPASQKLAFQRRGRAQRGVAPELRSPGRVDAFVESTVSVLFIGFRFFAPVHSPAVRHLALFRRASDLNWPIDCPVQAGAATG